jgi:hypothetical protein
MKVLRSSKELGYDFPNNQTNDTSQNTMDSNFAPIKHYQSKKVGKMSVEIRLL